MFCFFYCFLVYLTGTNFISANNMSKLIFLLFFFFLILSCQGNRTTAISEEDTAKDEESVAVAADTVEKATAIFWIDMKDKQHVDDPVIRTAKARVNILDNGRVELQSFLKEQSGKVQRYIRYKLESFRVTKIMMDSGFVSPGEQYVQLRYKRGLADQFK